MHCYTSYDCITPRVKLFPATRCGYSQHKAAIRFTCSYKAVVDANSLMVALIYARARLRYKRRVCLSVCLFDAHW